MAGRKAIIADVLSSQGNELCKLAAQFMQHLSRKLFTPSTYQCTARSINYFLAWALDRQIKQVSDVSGQVLCQYQDYLLSSQSPNGRAWRQANRNSYLVGLRKFCAWLYDNGYLIMDIAKKIKFSQAKKAIRTWVPSHEQVESIISQPDIHSNLGLRDRAVLEVLYSTGVRRAELANVQITDVDIVNGTVYIAKGKGGGCRLVPLGERAGQWLGKYLAVRSQLTKGKPTQALLVNYAGRAMKAGGLGRLVQGYVQQAGYKGSCHIFRHAMATQMLDNGADLRHIQEILGHQSIQTTHLYTHVALSRLRAVYEQSKATTEDGHRLEQAVNLKNTLPTKRHLRANTGQNSGKQASNELQGCVKEYLQQMARDNYSSQTIQSRAIQLGKFTSWCAQRDIQTVSQLNIPILQSYQRSLAKPSADGKTKRAGSIQNSVIALIMLCRFLAEQDKTLLDLSRGLEIPKSPKRIPCNLLSSQEILLLLSQPDIKTALGVRDKAILHTLAATGMRRMEITALSVDDIDFGQASVHIRHGKGDKDRFIPIAQNSLYWLEQYLLHVRPELKGDAQNNSLFLGCDGTSLCSRQINWIVKKYMKKANINKHGSCHILRHSLATIMLDNNADIRYIQQMLGHSDLQATQVYTKVAIRKLKQVHNRTHPAKANPSSHL